MVTVSAVVMGMQNAAVLSVLSEQRVNQCPNTPLPVIVGAMI